MASIISAGTTDSTSLNISGDKTGILQLASNNSTVAVTIDTLQNVGIGTTSPTATGGYDKAIDLVGGSNGAGLYIRGATNPSTVYASIQYDNYSNRTNINAVGTNNFLRFVTVDTERMRIDSSGRMTLPYQPAFRAYATTAQTPGSQVAIIFNNDSATNMFNIGSHYNTSNGRFTAPVTGVYVFQVQLLFSGQTAGTGGDTAIYKNGASIISFNRRRYTADATGYGGYLESATTNILKLTAGDYITVVNDASSRVLYVNDPNWTHFAGWLLG
jgi:hypothetical protein